SITDFPAVDLVVAYGHRLVVFDEQLLREDDQRVLGDLPPAPVSAGGRAHGREDRPEIRVRGENGDRHLRGLAGHVSLVDRWPREFWERQVRVLLVRRDLDLALGVPQVREREIGAARRELER